MQKCVLYWPERRGIYGRVEVLVQGVRECEHYTRRSLTLQCGGRSSTLQHYWYTSWPDHKTPDSTLPLLQLTADVEAERQASASRGPVIVHCRYTHTEAPPTEQPGLVTQPGEKNNILMFESINLMQQHELQSTLLATNQSDCSISLTFPGQFSHYIYSILRLFP